MNNSIYQIRESMPTTPGIQTRGELGSSLSRMGMVGRFALLISLIFPLLLGLVVFRVAQPELQLLLERLLIYLSPVMTMVATYVFGRRNSQVGAREEE